MTDKLNALLATKHISKHEYDTYMLFAVSQVGQEYLKYRVESAFMEEPHQSSGVDFAWHNGRMSVFRDIKMIIDRVNEELERQNNA